jgi:methylthioribulose-1-phosphate dehydratase
MAREGFAALASRLIEIGRRFYTRGWVLGTSGNFSAVLAREPLRLAITASSAHKGQLRAADILQCDEHGAVLGGTRRSAGGRPDSAGTASSSKRDFAGTASSDKPDSARPAPSGKPSAETLLHIEIARRRGAGAVLHTHSVWTTVLSDVHGDAGGFSIEGYEMLKGLAGVTSHEHREWLPIVENDQQMPRLAQRVGAMLDEHRDVHAFLLRRHGLYTWGETLADAERHIEILEFLFETVGRTGQFTIYNSQFTMDKRTIRS